MPTDDFDRANTWPTPGLGSNWTIQQSSGGLSIFGNEAIGLNVAMESAYWNADSFANDQYSAVIIGDSSRDQQGPAVRCAGTGASADCYYLDCFGNIGWQLHLMDDGDLTLLGSDTDGSHEFALSDEAELRVTSSSLAIFKNDVEVDGSPISDATLSAGAAGIGALSGTSSRMESWEGGDLGGGSSVVPGDCVHSHVSESPAITQVHAIVPGDCVHSHVAESPVVTQDHQIAPGDCVHAHASESPTVSQVHAVTPADVVHSHVSESPTITQTHTITPGDCVHAHIAESPTITVGGQIAPGDCVHSHTADSPSLTQVHIVTPADCLHAHACESPTVTIPSDAVPVQSVSVPARRSLIEVNGRLQLIAVPSRRQLIAVEER